MKNNDYKFRPIYHLKGYPNERSNISNSTSNGKILLAQRAIHEKASTEWMMNNLIMHYFATDEKVEDIEIKLIRYFNPPMVRSNCIEAF